MGQYPRLILTSKYVVHAQGRFGPGPELVRIVAENLDRQLPGAVGYFVIEGIDSLITDRELADAFQVQLMRDLWADYGSRCWSEQGRRTRMNVFRAEDGRLPERLVGRATTFKALHIDPHSIIFAHRYEVPDNLAGGDVLLADVRSYMKDSKVTVRDIFYPLRGKHDEGRLVARDEHRARMLKGYCTRVPAPEIGCRLVIVRNHPGHGVAHEITEITPAIPGKTWRRSFLRTSIAPLH